MMPTAMSKRIAAHRHGGALKLHRNIGFGEVSISPSPPRNSENAPVSASGTVLAIDYIISGVPPHSARASSRGGARNRADRESHALTVAHVANLVAASAHAALIGLPFTRMITIHWAAAEIPLERMAKATGRFVDLLVKALTRHGSRTAWLWTHENGHGKGGHCHLLVHVPAALVRVVTRLQKGWLRAITGKPYRARVILSKPIGGRLGLEVGNPDLHAVNLSEALSYILKGAGEAAAAKFRLTRLEAGGRVIGKRCATSQNIAPKARRFGANEKHELR